MLSSLYGVLKCRALKGKSVRGTHPHYHIHGIGDKIHYRLAINVKSQEYPSEVLYSIEHHFTHPITTKLITLPVGFTHIDDCTKATLGIDYIQGDFFDIHQMQPLAHDIPGPNNDLNEKIDALIAKTVHLPDSMIYAFGERWGPENIKDKFFKFTPCDGIHDIHMNQNNVGIWESKSESWQDGALFIHFLPEDVWTAVFLAFQSQTLSL